MDGALAIKRYFDFETVIPCHYGTFDVLASPRRLEVHRGDARRDNAGLDGRHRRES
jgi:L-ascorbate metabolism protein UlaG (beta-lactamase superfamily)